MGLAQTLAFKELNYDDKWVRLNRWLDGLDGIPGTDQLDNLLLATLDLVARLVRKHPTWG